MGCDRAPPPQTETRPRASARRSEKNPERNSLRLENRLYLGGHAPAIWFSHHLLAAAETMVGRRDVGADLARAVETNGCGRENRMVPSCSGWSICSRQKRGNGIGKTKVGKGTKVMIVSDGNGVPIGLYLDSAHHHEIRLAEATLKTVRVPQRRGRPRTRPKELVADKAYDSRSFRIWLRRRGIKPTIPTIQRKSRKPRRGRPI